MTSRRSFVRRTSAAVGLAGLAGLAGCGATDLPGLDAEGQSTETTTAGGTTSAAGGDDSTTDGESTTAGTEVIGEPGTAIGTVEGKRVLAPVEGSSEPVVWVNATDVTVRDERYAERFSKSNVTVTEGLAAEFEESYGRPVYEVTFRLDSNDPVHEEIERGDLVRYRIGRAAFNEVGLGEEVRFVVAGTRRPRVKELVLK